MRRLRLVYWRWSWERHWRRHRSAEFDAYWAFGMTPRPPDLHYRGERVEGLRARCRLLLGATRW